MSQHENADPSTYPSRATARVQRQGVAIQEWVVHVDKGTTQFIEEFEYAVRKLRNGLAEESKAGAKLNRATAVLERLKKLQAEARAIQKDLVRL